MRSGLLVLALLCAAAGLAPACGGREILDGNGKSGGAGGGGGTEDADGSSEAAGGDSSGGGTEDASDGSSPDAPTTEGGGPESGVTCTPGGSVSEGTGTSCSVKGSETCSDGTVYSFQCDCPLAQCECSSQKGMMGMAAVGISFAGGCPTCGESAAWAACKFPH